MPDFYNYCKSCIAKLFRNDKGQTMIEYVMLIVLIAVGVFIASPSMTDAIIGIFQGTSSLLTTSMSS
jgi:Flp pilus assembly pilin Flp